MNTTANYINAESIKTESNNDVENRLWNALEMDDFSTEIVYDSFPNEQIFKMGTIHTEGKNSQHD
jgi:hypothetical protein